MAEQHLQWGATQDAWVFSILKAKQVRAYIYPHRSASFVHRSQMACTCMYTYKRHHTHNKMHSHTVPVARVLYTTNAHSRWIERVLHFAWNAFEFQPDIVKLVGLFRALSVDALSKHTTSSDFGFSLERLPYGLWTFWFGLTACVSRSCFVWRQCTLWQSSHIAKRVAAEWSIWHQRFSIHTRAPTCRFLCHRRVHRRRGHGLFAANAHRHLLRVLAGDDIKDVAPERRTGHDDNTRRAERHPEYVGVAGGWRRFERILYGCI